MIGLHNVSAILLAVAVACLASASLAQTEYCEDSCSHDSLTGGFWSLNDKLAESGFDLSLNMTQVYQQNTRGGLSTNGSTGRYSGSYDLELTADLETLLGIGGMTFLLAAEGSWPDAEGINDRAVGSAFGVNDDAAGSRSIDITELWFEQSLYDGNLLIRAGKLDLSGGFQCNDCPVAFDASIFANDETCQFLNSALVNNPTIPFPDDGLGIAVYTNLTENWYLAAGAADAQADTRETGFNTAGHNEDYFFFICETGLAGNFEDIGGRGAYRVGFWYDPQDKDRIDGTGSKRDDNGFYLTFDQLVWQEDPTTNDDQGIGCFARYGWSSSQLEPIVTNFWSLGLQYKGIVPGRDADVLGSGFAQGIFSDQADLNDDSESVFELYYNILLMPWVTITPSVQYVANPGGSSAADDAVVCAVRMQMTF